MSNEHLPIKRVDSDPPESRSPGEGPAGAAPAHGVAAESKPKHHPFRRAVLRGLALILPPLLTIVVFLWAWHVIEDYVLVPIESTARSAIVWAQADTYDRIPDDTDPAYIMVRTRDADRVSLATLLDGKPAAGDFAAQAKARGGTIIEFRHGDRVYVPIGNESEGVQWIPQGVFDAVNKNPGERRPDTADGYYNRYVDITILRRERVIPIFLLLFVLFLYLLGKFLAAGVGRILWNAGESIVHKLPIIRNVYSSVKQVTDFALSERELQFNRIVAVEYPRKGVWSIGFVTGEGMKDVADRTGERILAVLMPTSPMPATGFTIMVKKSETIDLNISMDQAIQFVVSCGVVSPVHQQQHPVAKNVAAAITHAGAPADDAALTSS